MDNCVATGNIIIDKENQDLIPVMLKMNPRKERRTVVLQHTWVEYFRSDEDTVINTCVRH